MPPFYSNDPDMSPRLFWLLMVALCLFVTCGISM